jgi:hypothetical protein
MKSVSQPESLAAEALEEAELAAVHGGSLSTNLRDLLQPVRLLPRLPVLPVLRPIPIRLPHPPPPPDPIRVLRPVLF